MIIFDGPLDEMTEGFDTVLIKLDGKMSSDLNWKEAEEIANEAVSRDLAIFWDLDLGLFDRLAHPLASEMQLKGLSLSLDHFYQFLWPKFGEKSLGLALYRGSIDFSLGLAWDSEQQACYSEWLEGRDTNIYLKSLYFLDVALSFLHLLLPHLPQTLDPYLLLDASSVVDPLLLARLLDGGRFDRIKRAIKGSQIPHREIQWGVCPYAMDFKGFLGNDCSKRNQGDPAPLGILLPQDDRDEGCLKKVLEILQQKKVLYRLVSQEQLISDWDGLDDLIVCEKNITPLTKRKLLGFSAAGGRIVSHSKELIGVPIEISLSDWLSNK